MSGTSTKARREEINRLRARVKALEEELQRTQLRFLKAGRSSFQEAAEEYRAAYNDLVSFMLDKGIKTHSALLFEPEHRPEVVEGVRETLRRRPGHDVTEERCEACLLIRKTPHTCPLANIALVSAPEEDGRENDGASNQHPAPEREDVSQGGGARVPSPAPAQEAKDRSPEPAGPIPPSWAEVREFVLEVEAFFNADDPLGEAADALLSRLSTTEPGPDAFYCSGCRVYVGEHRCAEEEDGREPSPLRRRKGCPDLDPEWHGPLGDARGPTLCVTYPKCKCGREDAAPSPEEGGES